MNAEQFKKNPGVENLNTIMTPYFMANLAVKTAVISFTVSAFTQPFQAVLTQMQMPSNTVSGLNGGFFRGLYRGFLPYAVAGQKRGAVAELRSSLTAQWKRKNLK